MHYDVIIVGGGASGLMCALTAGQAGKKVLVLEKAKKVGRKILMSGGGRCNFTNLDVTPANYLCENPHFVKSALNQYTHWAFIEAVAQAKIPYHERDLGKLFCDRSAKDILNLLLAECREGDVKILTDVDVQQIHKDNCFQVLTSAAQFTSTSVVMASGGLSIPSMGVTGFSYSIAEQFGHEIMPLRAGLVPFVFDGRMEKLLAPMSGNAFPMGVSAGGAYFMEPVLFTHKGLSGPASLQASNYWSAGLPLTLDILPQNDVFSLMKQWREKQGKTLLRTQLSQLLPKKLVLLLQQRWWPQQANQPLADWRTETLEEIAHKIHAWQVFPAKTEGYKTAEVTLGGVSTACISSKTMSSELCKGLYFIGEAVDVTGHLGGYNFQWAWSSGVVAGRNAADE